MINKLIPEQVAKFWDVIKYGIQQSLPPIVVENESTMNRILTSCLCGQTEVWAIYDREESKVNFKGIALTRELVDDVSMTKSLLLYSLYGYTQLTNQVMEEGLKYLAEYAQSKNCSQIVAYSAFPRIEELAKSLGANTSYFISFDLDRLSKNCTI